MIFFFGFFLVHAFLSHDYIHLNEFISSLLLDENIYVLFGANSTDKDLNQSVNPMEIREKTLASVTQSVKENTKTDNSNQLY